MVNFEGGDVSFITESTLTSRFLEYKLFRPRWERLFSLRHFIVPPYFVQISNIYYISRSLI